MSKNFDSPIEIGFCGSVPERGEDVKLPVLQGPTETIWDALQRHRELLRAALKENARLAANPKVGDCVICGTSIWSNQPRIDIGAGFFHPMCDLNRKLKEAEALRDERLLQRERDLYHIRCQLMDANAKIAELEHGIQVIQFNSANNAAAADIALHKAEEERDQALSDKDAWRQLSKEFQERLHEVKAERDELSNKVIALIAQLTPLIIPEAK